ncbi:aminoacyl-tRNA hydrolase [Candidatus Dependentiae bacterium]|nr:aminoacyl-tRNA hydrolase [Candidatus Dependentiae bacterium]
MLEQLYDFRSIKAIIGLGNPGAKYYHTRHNIGFRVVDSFAERYGAQWGEVELMQYAGALLPDRLKPVYLIKPLTFMNNAGRVLPFLLMKGIKPEQILVVHDELEKPFGKLSIRFDGSARGHNGLRSIIGVVGNGFWRLRFGIGRPEKKSLVGDFVLSRFSQEEEEDIMRLIEEAIILTEGGGR